MRLGILTRSMYARMTWRCAGRGPRFYLPTVLLPVGATEEDVREICDQLGAACRALDIVVAGGHTEVTAAVNQPVVAGTMLGEGCAGEGGADGRLPAR